MQTSNANQNIKPDNPVWHLLSEFSLSEIMSDNVIGDELTPGFLKLPFQELGIPLEWFVNIKLTLTRLAKEAQASFNRRRLELPGSIRIFCHRNVIGDVNLAQTSRLEHSTQTIERAAILDHSGTIMNGGWGYFIIERLGSSADFSDESHSFFDLYPYKEGE